MTFPADQGVLKCTEGVKTASWVFSQKRIEPNLFFSENNVCFIKICTKLSSALLLCLVWIFMKQTLNTGKTFKGGWEVLTVFLAMFHLTTEKKRVLVQSIYVKQCSLLSLHLLSTLVTDLDYVLSQFEDFFATKMTKSIITFAFWTNQLKFLWQIQWTSMQNFQLWLDFISSHRIYKIGLLFTLRESHARNDIRDLTPKDTNFKWRAKKQNNNKK